MSRFASISGNPVVHLVIAAFIGAAVPVLIPVVSDGFQAADLDAVNLALGAGLGAVLRAIALAVPAKA